MPIRQLVINHFRNLSSVTLNPFPGVNIFHGKNASGKQVCRSYLFFRTRPALFAPHSCTVSSITMRIDFLFLLFLNVLPRKLIGIERSRQGERKIRLQGKTITSLAPLAKELPLQLLTTIAIVTLKKAPNSSAIFQDWGVFHVEQTFYSIGICDHQALKQCNTGLKKQLSQREIEIWHEEMNPLALF